jgi:hypothetical protein
MASKRPQYTGRCMLCKEIVNKRQITHHLKRCLKEHAASGGRTMNLFHIAAEGSHLPMYWIRVELPGASTLDDLDRFLRRIWLECCDHMSCFTIDGQEYSVRPLESILFGPRGRTMTHKIYTILSPGMKFTHEYDYGSTTHLSLRVVGVRNANVESPGITLLARNEPPAWKCCKCGTAATRIRATGWGLDLDGLFCDDCVDDDEDWFLPVVNSPRVGTCGYCG